jgi:hypothetical protein
VLACGGPDSVPNLQWQTVAAAKAKDRRELEGLRSIALLKASRRRRDSSMGRASNSTVRRTAVHLHAAPIRRVPPELTSLHNPESLELIRRQLARLPPPGQLAETAALGIIFATMMPDDAQHLVRSGAL